MCDARGESFLFPVLKCFAGESSDEDDEAVREVLRCRGGSGDEMEFLCEMEGGRQRWLTAEELEECSGSSAALARFRASRKKKGKKGKAKGGGTAPQPVGEPPRAATLPHLSVLRPLCKAARHVVLSLSGSFNPCHRGHLGMLLAARRFIERRYLGGGVARVVGALLTPSSDAACVQKLGPEAVPARHRAAMLLLAVRECGMQDWVAVDPFLADCKDGNPGMAAAAAALGEAVRGHYGGAESVELGLVCGADLLPRMGKALRSKALVVCVVNRPASFDVAAFAEQQRREVGARVVVAMEDDECDMSSTAVRRAMREGDEAELRRMMWPSVLEYHRKHGIDYADGAADECPQLASKWRDYAIEVSRQHLLPEKAVQSNVELGRGATALVVTGWMEGRVVAVKQVLLLGDLKAVKLRAQCAMRELEAAAKLAFQDCRDFVCFSLGTVMLGPGQRGVGIVLPLFSCALADVLHELSDASAQVVIDNTARGMRAVARAGLLHRDLHCRNVLVQLGGGAVLRAAVCDFGLSQSDGGDQTAVVRGAVRTYAPEAARNHYTKRADVFSWALLSAAALNRRDDYSYAEDAVERLKAGHRPELPENARHRELIASAWSEDWMLRPTFEVIVDDFDRLAGD